MTNQYQEQARDFYRKLKQVDYQSAAIALIAKEFEKIADEAIERAQEQQDDLQ